MTNFDVNKLKALEIAAGIYGDKGDPEYVALSAAAFEKFLTPDTPAPVDLDLVFGYHPLSSDEIVKAHEQIRSVCSQVAAHVYALVPDCRERERSIEALDDAMKHANAGIARHQPPPELKQIEDTPAQGDTNE